MKEINQSEFILGHLIGPVEKIYKEHPYQAMCLMMCGVEMLGSLWDNQPLHEKGLSRQRFETSIKKLFPEKYIPFNTWENEFNLYKYLRCPLLHVFLISEKIALAGNDNFRYRHLKIHERGCLVVSVYEFFDDYRVACLLAVTMTEEGMVPSKISIEVEV
jgi:hypothetical protein